MPLIIFLIYLLCEIWVSFVITDFIGVLGFFLEVLLSAFLGFAILVNFRIFFSDALMRLKNRAMSYEAFVSSNIFRILGAFLLILPGALSDIIGLLMQFSTLGFFFVKPFVKNPKNKEDSEIIDVEVIDEKIAK